MVFLGACVFTSMMTFQATYARASGLDFSIFFVTYTSAVIVSRFTIAGWVGRHDPLAAATALLSIMTLSLIGFLFSPQREFVYGLSGAGLGIGYGLVYPLIQALAVNLTQKDSRGDALSFFSLAYFIGVFGFPIIGGWLIVRLGYTGFIILLIGLGASELGIAVWRWLAGRRADGRSAGTARRRRQNALTMSAVHGHDR